MKKAYVIVALGAIAGLVAAICAAPNGDTNNQVEDVLDPNKLVTTDPITIDPADGKLIRLDTPGVEKPRLVPASEARVLSTDDVIGVSVNGIHRAYTIEALTPLDQHVVNVLFGSTPITIAYCDRNDCARVFTSKEPDQLLGVGVGGFLMTKKDPGMVLWHAGKHYRHFSEELPFEDFKFERVKWADWLEAHPDTLVYDGVYRSKPSKPAPLN